jgi:hypothetical protein
LSPGAAAGFGPVQMKTFKSTPPQDGAMRKTMFADLYGRYRQALEATPFDDELVGYERDELPKTLSGAWSLYGIMFAEYSREIANSINQLTDYTHRLTAWNEVISPMTDQDKFYATHEFIDPIATVGLNLPYVIRSRFIFAVTHLCHQANRLRGRKPWRDDLPLDNEIYFNTLDSYGVGWRKYNKFKRCIEKMGDRAYKTATHDFRDAYNHRFSLRIVFGQTRFITRRPDSQTATVGYSFGGMPALSLDVITKLLREQSHHSRVAFEAFQNLVREHAACIS